MRLRQETAPRHGVDRAAMTARPERHDEINHGQAGAADEHSGILSMPESLGLPTD